jgi:hypothetical protein
MKIISQLNKRDDAAVTQPEMYYTDNTVLRLTKQSSFMLGTSLARTLVPQISFQPDN